MIKKLFIFLLLILSVVMLHAQFEVPRLSQYLNNGLSFNPAYAGSREALSITGVSRTMYAGFDGHPNGFMLGVDAPVGEGKIALGGTVESKSYPGYSNTGVYTNYAFRTQVGSGWMSLGLKAGLYSYKLDYSGLDLKDQNDMAFANKNGFAPNFGAGMYFYNNKFFVGLSVPYFLNLPELDGGINFDTKSYHYYLMTGYLLSLSKDLKIKPSVFVDYSISNLDIQGGINIILLNDKLWLGGLYRTTSKTATAILELQLTSFLKIGLAYDYSFTNISRVSNGTYEMLFRYENKFVADVANPFYF
jgi:type IX secretion system PorP/SprF family membrane protein